MPRYVDHAARRRLILETVIAALAEGGLENLTLRSLAQRLGGSVTLVTHYFPTKEELVTAALDQIFTDAERMLGELRVIEDPHRRLIEVVNYFLPTDDEGLQLERVRVATIIHRNGDPIIGQFFERLEPAMRAVIRTGIESFYPADQLDDMVDLYRSWLSGMALSAVEHPEIWTPERRKAVLAVFLRFVAIDLKVTDPSRA